MRRQQMPLKVTHWTSDVLKNPNRENNPQLSDHWNHIDALLSIIFSDGLVDGGRRWFDRCNLIVSLLSWLCRTCRGANVWTNVGKASGHLGWWNGNTAQLTRLYQEFHRRRLLYTFQMIFSLNKQPTSPKVIILPLSSSSWKVGGNLSVHTTRPGAPEEKDDRRHLSWGERSPWDILAMMQKPLPRLNLNQLCHPNYQTTAAADHWSLNRTFLCGI